MDKEQQEKLYRSADYQSINNEKRETIKHITTEFVLMVNIEAPGFQSTVDPR